MKVLLISSDPAMLESMAVAGRSLQRAVGEPIEFLEASDGVRGMALAWRHHPQVVLADEIMSRAGGFAVARDLKGAAPPFSGRVVIFLDRSQDEWLAEWSGADAWFVKPVNPFELADRLTEFFTSTREEAV